MGRQKTFLLFGATGRTGQHFVPIALADGHRVRVLARTPAKLVSTNSDIEVRAGSVTDALDLDELVHGADFIISMLGDVRQQRTAKVNTAFVRRLVPAMRRQGVKRFLYQAGGLSKPPGRQLALPLRVVRSTIARGYNGQHEDNEAVMEYLASDAADIEWMVHRAGIGSNGPSKGVLERSARAFSIATFQDCAAYNFRTVQDPAAIHTCDLSHYRTSRDNGGAARSVTTPIE